MTTRIYMCILLVLAAMSVDLMLQADSAHANFAIPPFTATENGVSTHTNATVDSAGTAHLVWTDSVGGLHTRTRTPEGALGPVRELAAFGVEAQLAADTGGNVQFAWRGSSGSKYVARTRRLGADGTLSKTVDLSSFSDDAFDLRLAAGPGGGATFVWCEQLATGYVVQARRVAPDGTLGQVKDISTVGGTGQPELAVDDAGNAVFVWKRFIGGWWVAEARRWAADGSLGPILELTLAGAHAGPPQVALDAAGNARIAVTRGNALLTRRLGADSVLGPANDIREQPGDSAQLPRLAVDGNGNAQVVWRAVLEGGVQLIQTRREHADGSFGPVQNLWPWTGGINEPRPEVEFDGAGNAHHVWLDYSAHANVVGRMVSKAGALGQIQQLSGTTSPFEGGNSSYLQLATGPGGNTVAAWTQTAVDSSAAVVQGAVASAPTPAADAGPIAGGTGTGTGPSADGTAPALSGLALRPAKLAVRRRGRVTYSLSEPARVVLRVVRRGTGRRVGSIRASGRAGRNSLSFRGRLNGRWLRPSRYVFVAVATDAAGNRSAPRRARFRVVRRAD
jgi:hypothetical protein